MVATLREQKDGKAKYAKLKKLLLRTLLMGCSLGCTILLVELGLRIAGISFPKFYIPDDIRGASLRPGAQGWSRQEGESFVKINNDGWRDRDHARQKPAGTVRIAVLGDSYAEALQVSMEKTFWALMEQELQTCEAFSNRPIEAMNFGMQGYGTAQELQTLRHRVWDYSPDIVVLAFCTGNDIRNNYRELENQVEVSQRPYYILKDGNLVLDDSFLNSAAYKARKTGFAKLRYWLIGHSRLLQVANQAKNVREIERRRAPPMVQNQTPEQAVLNELGFDSNVFKPPTDPVWKEAWAVTEAMLKQVNDDVKSHRAKFLLVTVSSAIQVHPDSRVRQQFMVLMGISDLFYPDQRLHALGQREGFEVLNLAPLFQAYADKNRAYLHGFKNTRLGTGHWNEEGHKLAASLISDAICRSQSAKP